MLEFQLFALPDETLTDISLVEYPAIESNWLCFSKDTRNYALSTDERHIVTGAALIPDKRIYRNDGNGEYMVYFSKDTVRKVAEQFFTDFKNKSFTLEHSENTNNVVIVESWIKETDADKSVALGLNVPNGTWLISAKVNDPELWKRIKAGEFNGFSVAGSFRTMHSPDEEIIAEAEEYLADRPNILNNK